MSPPADEDVAQAWVEHLRGGGTTPWRGWLADVDLTVRHRSGAPGAGPGAHLPGAAQLELVRRLARRHAQSPVPGLDFTVVADRVLNRPGPGRGRPDLRLAWPDPHAGPDGRVDLVRTAGGHGAPAVDPAQVPATELVRIGVGVLADLLLETPPGTRARGRRRRRLLRGRPFRLAGAPVAVRTLRAALAADRHRPGGRRPTVLVLAAPFDDAVQQAWTARVLRGSAARWGRFVLRRVTADRLPGAVDAARVADRWAQRVGADRVHVVVGRHDDPAVRRTAAEVLGIGVPDAAYSGPLTAAEVDVVRRLNAVLKVRLRRRRHRAVLRRGLVGLFDHPPHPPLRLPAGALEWAERHSARVVEALAAGGYAVHGDLEQVARPRTEPVDRPQPGRVLDATLTACLRAAARKQERERGRTAP